MSTESFPFILMAFDETPERRITKGIAAGAEEIEAGKAAAESYLFESTSCHLLYTKACQLQGGKEEYSKTFHLLQLRLITNQGARKASTGDWELTRRAVWAGP